MPKPEPVILYSKVKLGKLDLTKVQRGMLENFLRVHEGKEVVFHLEIADQDKSAAMMKAYRGLWLPAIAQHIGIETDRDSLDSLHKDLMLRFNPVYETNLLGQTIVKPGSLKDFTHYQFIDYIEQLDRWFGTQYGEALPETKKKK